MNIINYKIARDAMKMSSQIEKEVFTFDNKWKGGNASAFVTLNASDIVSDADKLKLNTITLPVKVLATSSEDSKPELDVDSWENIKHIALELKEKGFIVIIEPYPYIAEGSVGETDWNPDDIESFFNHWGEILYSISSFCHENHINGIYIASNLVHMESFFEKWEHVVNQVRIFFNGKIIYRTNWWITASWAPELEIAYQQKLNNPIFGLVDVISIATYFEVTDAPVPTVEEIKKGIFNVPLYGRGQNIYNEILNFYKKWNKPIFFGELGIPPYKGAAAKPWAYNFDESDYDETVQANWFEAWYEVFKNEYWFKGYSVYNIADPTSTFNVIDKKAEICIKKQVFRESRLDKLERELKELKELVESIVDH